MSSLDLTERPHARTRERLRHPWVSFAIWRSVGLLVTLAAIVVSVFFMLQLVPGDPVLNGLGADAPKSQIEEIRAELGLDRSLPEQLVSYADGLLQGDMGNAFFTRQPVVEIIGERIGSSLQLAAAALAIVLLGGVSVGMAAAALTRDGRRPGVEVGFSAVTSALSAIPDFVWGTVLVYVFAISLGLLPVAGSGSLEHLVLPAIAVALPSMVSVARIVRTETLNVMAQDYIRTATSERLPARRIYLRHALPNVLTAALTISGLVFANLIGGTVVVEQVFARGGLGESLVSAVIAKDYPVVMGITLVLAFAVVLVNTVVDVILGLLDPRSLAKEL